MGFPERRHLERISPERVVYLDLKPGNGGVVLNVSGQGLCFQSVAPVKKHQALTFSICEHDVHSDGVGEVVWIDKSCKFGGLRFTQVSKESLEGIGAIAKAAALRKHEEPLPALPLVPLVPADEEGVTEALIPLKIETMLPFRAPQQRKIGRLPARGQLRSWASRILITALAVYGVWATVALVRYRTLRDLRVPVSAQSHPLPEVKSSVSSHAAASQQIKPPSATEKPSAAINAAPRKNRSLAPKTKDVSYAYSRPVMKAAPIAFEYPEVGPGSRSGKVDLALLISATGIVEAVKVIGGSGTLASASVRAARRWRYRPLQLNGRAVEAEAHVRMSFAGDDAVSIHFQN